MNYNRRLVCLCGTPPILKISWTNDNLGRRFLDCRHYGFFDWYDLEFPSQANTVILGLLKKSKKQQKQLNCRWMLKLILGISLICNVILFFYLVCR
ncbi:hypothetical protein H5410_041791 [Solanum commersonii]|uniref:Zinc finger GRF-type domain-containing protein n=1 Tax=Solanum commersonii TaxID=4109 RepID=A0A9J5XTV7_SOLCO|nr:hypothetical protein H5410_041791 [Solanum commersonii]